MSKESKKQVQHFIKSVVREYFLDGDVYLGKDGTVRCTNHNTARTLVKHGYPEHKIMVG